MRTLVTIVGGAAMLFGTPAVWGLVLGGAPSISDDSAGALIFGLMLLGAIRAWRFALGVVAVSAVSTFAGRTITIATASSTPPPQYMVVPLALLAAAVVAAWLIVPRDRAAIASLAIAYVVVSTAILVRFAMIRAPINWAAAVGFRAVIVAFIGLLFVRPPRVMADAVAEPVLAAVGAQSVQDSAQSAAPVAPRARYCSQCGQPLGATLRFCDACGAPLSAPASPGSN